MDGNSHPWPPGKEELCLILFSVFRVYFCFENFRCITFLPVNSLTVQFIYLFNLSHYWIMRKCIKSGWNYTFLYSSWYIWLEELPVNFYLHQIVFRVYFSEFENFLCITFLPVNSLTVPPFILIQLSQVTIFITPSCIFLYMITSFSLGLHKFEAHIF